MPDLFGEDNAMQRDACFSACGRYRWSLSRAWDADLRKPWIAFIMLNPSTADAEQDDPTIRRCVAFAKAWGFAGLSVRNLFAYRATQPVELLEADDPVGSENDAAITGLIGVRSPIVAAWGTGGGLRNRQQRVIDMFTSRGVALKCLGKTKDGFPRHPLYVPADAQLIDY